MTKYIYVHYYIIKINSSASHVALEIPLIVVLLGITVFRTDTNSSETFTLMINESRNLNVIFTFPILFYFIGVENE